VNSRLAENWHHKLDNAEEEADDFLKEKSISSVGETATEDQRTESAEEVDFASPYLMWGDVSFEILISCNSKIQSNTNCYFNS
jgi:mevalonate pyrophosphate decarboxylase